MRRSSVRVRSSAFICADAAQSRGMERRLTHGLCGICGRAMILQGACTSKAEASQELRIHVNCPPDPRMKMRALAVLGVNTGVGKTHVSTLILRGLRKVRDLDVLPFKPLESGVEAHGGVPQDAARLLKASGLAAALEDVCPWQLPRPEIGRASCREREQDECGGEVTEEQRQ